MPVIRMVHVPIKGIDVDFPFNPYSSQINYMEKVITCLQDKKNGVLESPTGTGKTLSLLCAALAWREAYVARMQLNSNVMKTTGSEFERDVQETLDTAVGFGITSNSQAIPKIIYASRTHSQLSQAVSELKNTSYRPKICVLGSRDQMCINNDVTRLESSTAKVYACKAKISSRSCMFYNNLEANKNNKDFTTDILDIEDLGKLGQRHSVCPYFMTRELRTNADLIFMPYNYVLDFKSRQAHSIDLNNTILLLDEAHNVEKVCEDAASFELTAFDLASAQDDCNECVNILKERQDFLVEGEEEQSLVANDLTPEDAAHLKNVFKNIESMIAEPTLSDGKFSTSSSFLFNGLKKLKIDSSTVKRIIDAIDQCNMLLASQVSKPHKGKHFALQKMADVLKILFCRTGEPVDMNYETGRFYKVFIRKEEMTQFQKSQISAWERNATSGGRTLSYWCFHAGIAMKDIARQGIRSLIVTSGTLSPLDSFISELAIPFQVQLQNPHVISSNQMFAAVITKGPDGKELNSSYAKRLTSEYLNSLGNLLVNVSRTTPHGLLVFFPSYPVMDGTIKAWSQTGILDRIAQKKPHFIEPRSKKELATQMDMFYEKINDAEFKGAVFFAVCRGKVSEGLDFADDNGRVVVITGLPFPPRMDPKVELKMQFLDAAESRKQLSGNQWYRQQASRAVNQAVGRVIRHNKDYGAILLCDVRFTSRDAMSQLPQWMKPYVRTYDDFGAAQRTLITFFRYAESIFSTHAKTKKQVENLGSGNDAVSKKISQSRRQIAVNDATDSNRRNYNSVATNSLAALKAGNQPSARGSIFQSLSDANHRKPDQFLGQSSGFSATILAPAKNRSRDKDSRTKSKKFKIVSKRSEEISTEPSKGVGKKSSETTRIEKPDAKSCGKDSGDKAAKVLSAREYVSTCMGVMSKDDYKMFFKIFTNYKKTHDVNDLIKGCGLLFREKPYSHLMRGLGQFINNEHDRCLFFKACEDLVADDLPKEKMTEPASKKQRLSAGIDESENTKPSTDFFPTLSDDGDDEDEYSDVDCEGNEDVLAPKCIICVEVAKAPHKAPCNHIACYQCWAYHLRNEKTCPSCKVPFRPRKLVKIYMT